MPDNLPSDRTEFDFLGSIAVPAAALYGAQTARALANFRISGIPLSDYGSLLRSMASIKRAAVRTNLRLGDMDPKVARAIEQACDEVIADGHAEHFPIDMFQGGAGTSTNMNMNEVLANRALQILGLALRRPAAGQSTLEALARDGRSPIRHDRQGSRLYPASVSRRRCVAGGHRHCRQRHASVRPPVCFGWPLADIFFRIQFSAHY